MPNPFIAGIEGSSTEDVGFNFSGLGHRFLTARGFRAYGPACVLEHLSFVKFELRLQRFGPLWH